ncbi:proline-rich protein 29 isoform X2 [Sceloporus undulatus]|uniref:proline-rich protein 29 isoform X2 n=1 Tax=Sceloporus undulatus TaxID=8520 RepID=UPI001C4BD8C2|nr:proline-rich protein 29 isoform X2 [Sceloporus undulatus]
MDPGRPGFASPKVHFIQQPIVQQPEVTILQQVPWIPSAFPPSYRKEQIREDLMELMMIQNAQMHQVVMNNMAMSVAAQFGNNPEQVPHVLWQIEDNEEDDPAPCVFHHHYALYPGTLPFMAWPSTSQPSTWPRQHPTIRHVGPDPQTPGRQDGIL